MSDLLLVIGDKRLSSWSLRPWLALKVIGVPFTEKMVRLDRPGTRATLLAHSPTGRVPVLKADGLVIWDSLAIGEYLAERYPAARLWPQDRAQRARARAISAEMHAGFADLRQDFPMDLARPVERRPAAAGAAADIRRVTDIWEECRAAAEGAGPFLFGSFGLADAMYAPVAFRFQTYGVELPARAAAYRDRLLALPAMAEWRTAALAER